VSTTSSGGSHLCPQLEPRHFKNKEGIWLNIFETISQNHLEQDRRRRTNTPSAHLQRKMSLIQEE
jgi:hypothetical protein